MISWRLMKCPHCNVGIHEEFHSSNIFNEQAIIKDNQPVAPGLVWTEFHLRCPECYQSVIYIQEMVLGVGPRPKFLVYPVAPMRAIPPEVIDPYRQDFVEACTVLPYSPKASAALSRRCLQAILRDKAGTTKKDLYDQIEEVITSGKVPSHVAGDLHAVRVIGNFAAHPMKSTTSVSIVDVEPGEAEWNLEVVESLFDFYFVEPTRSAHRKAQLNKKLREAGKPELP